MFTGIVEEVGQIVSRQGDILSIKAGLVPEAASVGNSIAVNGTCLTSTSRAGDVFSVDVSPETSRRTNLGVLKPGDVVNLERPLSYGGLMGGHFVQGHVEDVGEVVSSQPDGDSFILRFNIPSELMKYVVVKGFIAVDGISLTVVDREATSFTVAVLAYTYLNTVLCRRQPGDRVNIETDILARYVERLLDSGSEEKATQAA